MKKLLKISAVSGILAALSFGATKAEADVAYSTNTFAMVKVISSETNTLIAIPWQGYTNELDQVVNLPADHLVKPENLTAGDLLLALPPAGSTNQYEAWTLTTNEVKGVLIGTWTPTAVAQRKQDGLVSVEAPAADEVVMRGRGLWLVRQKPVDAEGNAIPFYLEGQYAKGPAEVKIDGVPAGQANPVMIAHPDCTRAALQINGDITWTGVEKGDTLSIPNGTDAWDYCVWDGTRWCVSRTEPVYAPNTQIQIAVKYVKKYDLSVPSGRGFWYVRRASGDVTITFTDATATAD